MVNIELIKQYYPNDFGDDERDEERADICIMDTIETRERLYSIRERQAKSMKECVESLRKGERK